MASAPPKTVSSSEASSVSESREFVTDSLATGVMFALVLTVIQRVVGFIRNILFCKIMTAEQLGQWSMVYSFLLLLAPLAVLGLPGCFGRYVEHYRKKGQLGTFVGRITKISIAFTLLLAVTMLAIPEWFSGIVFRDKHQVDVIFGMAFALVFVTAMNFLTSLLESLRQVRIVTIMRFTTGVAFAIIGTALMVLWQNKTVGATVGFGLACLLTTIPAMWYLVRNRTTLKGEGAGLTHTEMWARIAPFALWLWFSNILQNMFEISDRYMLIHWSVGTVDEAHNSVGQYHSGRVIPLLLVGVAAMLEGILLPYMTANVEAGKKDEARKQLNWTIKLIAVGFTLCSMVILLFAPLLFDWILEGRYDGGLEVLPLTMAYCIWMSLGIVGQSFLWVAEKGKLVMAATGVALVLNLALNAFLIPTMGLWGAVLATSIACFVFMAMFLELNRWLKCPTDRGVWLTALLPLVLILPIGVMLPVVVAIGMLGFKTEWVFTTEEKTKIADESLKVWAKITAALNR